MGREREVGTALELLHLDHERPLHATCHRWRAAMRAAARSWDDGPDGAALCHDLFGVGGVSEAHGAACVRFRCGPPRDAEGVVLQCCGPRVLLSVVAVVLGGFLHRECVHLCVLLWVSFECCFLRDRTPAKLPLTLYRPQFYSEPSHSSTCQTNSSHSFRKAHWVGPT